MFIYRCRLCGVKFHGNIHGVLPHDKIWPTIREMLADGAKALPGAVAFREDFHLCKNGGIGIGDLLGHHPDNEIQPEGDN